MRDQDYMRLAINLAKAGTGQTNPNPLVGAVIVKDGCVVGLGAHLKAGEDHAEVHAIRMAGAKAENATVYVTLEPCSHYGKTPPCANLLVKSRVRRVVIASTDPNPMVAGNGIKILQNAGIEVLVGILKEEADSLNPIYYHLLKRKCPYVTLKSAISLDGKIATSKGESKWITGEQARMDVHLYRSIHDAILVGVNTVISDDPSLTTRLPDGMGKNPIRIILDSTLRTPLHSKVVTDEEASTWIITANSVSAEQIKPYVEKGVKIFSLNERSISVPGVLNLLHEHGIASIFVEGGSGINGSFLKAKAIDQVITYIAPKLIGGRSAPTSIGGEGIEHISDVCQLTIESIEQLGDDIKIVSKPL